VAVAGHRPVRRHDEVAERVVLGGKDGTDGELGHRRTVVRSSSAIPERPPGQLAFAGCANCDLGSHPARDLDATDPPIGTRRVCQLRSGQPSRRPRSYTGRMGRTYRADAIVLRSMRFAEADRVLHLYTAERWRVHAIAKGVR